MLNRKFKAFHGYNFHFRPHEMCVMRLSFKEPEQMNNLTKKFPFFPINMDMNSMLEMDIQRKFNQQNNLPFNLYGKFSIGSKFSQHNSYNNKYVAQRYLDTLNICRQHVAI